VTHETPAAHQTVDATGLEATPWLAANEGDQELSAEEDCVVARVEGREISLSQLLRVTRSKEKRLVIPPNVPYESMVKRLRHDHLDQLVVQETLRQEVHRRGIKVTDREVENWLEATKIDNPKALEQTYPELVGMSVGDFREAVRDNLAIRKLMEEVYGRVQIPSDEQIRAYYDEHRDQFMTPSRVDAFVIVIMKEGRTVEEARQKAEEVRAIVAAEMDKAKSVGEMRTIMARNARLYSEHEPTRKGGGWWVIYEKSGLSDGKQDYSLFQKATYEIPVQELSPVFEMPHAFYITWVENREERRQHDFETVSDTIRRMILKEKREEVEKDFFQDLKSRYKIEEFEENLLGKKADES
jgi:parvulin-like peptidyl-prolyl isomerase